MYLGLYQTSKMELFLHYSAASDIIENFITMTVIPVGEVTFKITKQYVCDFFNDKCFRIFLEIPKEENGNVD